MEAAKKRVIEEIKASTAEYVTYGESEIGIPVKREDAIADLEQMDPIMIGQGTWYECDSEGVVSD